MIGEHQPRIFPPIFNVALSSVEDGNMKHSYGTVPEEVTENRRLFLKRVGTRLEDSVLVPLSYDTADFRRYGIAQDDEVGVSMEPTHLSEPKDALATQVEGRTLVLPVADCCAVALADTALTAIMLSHIGRHSAEQDGAIGSVEFMQAQFGSRPEDIVAWLSPAVGKQTYPLHFFGGKGLHEVIVEQLQRAGVPERNIEVCEVDTAQDDRYFSHSEFLQGRRPENGRHAISMTIEPPDAPHLLH